MIQNQTLIGSHTVGDATTARIVGEHETRLLRVLLLLFIRYRLLVNAGHLT